MVICQREKLVDFGNEFIGQGRPVAGSRRSARAPLLKFDQKHEQTGARDCDRHDNEKHRRRPGDPKQNRGYREDEAEQRRCRGSKSAR